MRDFARDYEYATDIRKSRPVPDGERRTFPGIVRPGGRIGTRNYLAVISSVNCSASTSQYVRARFPVEVLRRDYPNVDGIVHMTAITVARAVRKRMGSKP